MTDKTPSQTHAQEWFDEIVETRRSKRPSLKGAPLRKVIGTLKVEAGEFQGEMLYYTHELYECFHHEMPRSDMYGETNATRRRCRQCKPPE